MMEQLKPSIILDKALDTSKLTRKEITVTRGGTTFKQMRWVRPEQVVNRQKTPKQDKDAYIGTAQWLLDKDRDDNYKPIDKTKLVQPTGDIEDLYKRAEAVRPVFREWMEQVKDELGAAELLSRPALKSKERVMEKIAADGEKDASHIYDIDGHTLVFDDLDGVARALKYFLAHKATIRVKNNFAHPTALGYRDININVKLPNGMISEVQLNTKAMLEAKEKTAHIFYEVSREAETQCPPPPPPAPYSDVVEAQRAIYSYSWNWSRNQREFDETSFNASVFEIARPFWSNSINIIEQDATWLSEKTRKAFQALGSKANTLSSTSKNLSPSLSKSSFGIIVPPYAKHSTDKGRFAIGIDNITKSINKNKLIRKPVIVLREGKTYQATRWVRPNEVASQDTKESQAFGDSEHYMLQMVNDKPIEYDEKTIKIVYGSKDAYERANAQLSLNSFAPRGDEDLYAKAGDGQVREHGEAESGGGARRRAAPISPLLGEANKPVHPAFTENRKGQRRVSFVGQTVSGPRDIAELFQVYRNPQIESFHIIYLDSKGKILAHNAISSGTPGMTIAFHRWSDSGERWILNNRIDRLGADNVIILHNHPSGDVTPSSEDMAVTEAYSKMLGDKFGGHVIIDHDEATFIDSRAQSAVSLSYTPKEGAYDINLKYQIKGYSDAAKYAIDVMSVSPRKAALILTDTYLRIIEWRPFESANPRDIYQAVNESGGARAFIATSDSNFFDSVIEADNKAKSNGGKYRVLMDVVLVDKGKFINNSQRDIKGTDHYAYIINKKTNRKAAPTKMGKYLFEPHTDKYEKALEGKNMYDELLKARNPKLVQRIITVHGPNGVFQRRAWVLPEELNKENPKVVQFDLFDDGNESKEDEKNRRNSKNPPIPGMRNMFTTFTWAKRPNDVPDDWVILQAYDNPIKGHKTWSEKGKYYAAIDPNSKNAKTMLYNARGKASIVVYPDKPQTSKEKQILAQRYPKFKNAIESADDKTIDFFFGHQYGDTTWGAYQKRLKEKPKILESEEVNDDEFSIKLSTLLANAKGYRSLSERYKKANKELAKINPKLYERAVKLAKNHSYTSEVRDFGHGNSLSLASVRIGGKEYPLDVSWQGKQVPIELRIYGTAKLLASGKVTDATEAAGELTKSKKTGKLIPKKMWVTRDGSPYLTTVWVLPSEAHAIGSQQAVAIPYVAEGGSAYESIPDSVKNKEPKLITVEIASKGRKYLKAHYKGKTFDFNVAINDVTKDFEPGKSYTFPAIEQKEVNKYGTKLTYWPVDVDAEKRAEIEKKNEIEHEKNKAVLQQRIEAENKKEIERWLGYVEDKANDGYLYQKGVDKLKELHIEKWPDLDERLQDAATTAKIVGIENDTRRYLGYIKENIGQYWYQKGEQRVIENIDKLKELNAKDAEKYEKELNDLRDRYKKQVEEKERDGYEGKIYHIGGGSGYGYHEFTPHTVIRNPDADEPRYLYVLSAKKYYFKEDGMSFGVGDESGYIYQAVAREATDQESAPLRIEDERREKVKKAKERKREIAETIKKTGEYPHPGLEHPPEGARLIDGQYLPEGEVLLDTQDIYGGGDWFVIGDKYIWYVQNNGMDGDNWSLNNVRTGGAGAIGWRVPYSKELADELRRLDQIMKMPELEKVSIKKAIVNIGSKLLGRKEKSKASDLIARMKKLYPDEFAVGAKVEMEHTNDPYIAEIIAAQHLSENSKYYKKLLAADLVDEPEAITEAKKMGLNKSIRFVIRKSLPEKGDVEYAHKTPPKGYPKTKKKYADPNNYKYPLDTEKHVRAAIAYFSKPKNYSMYSPDERRAMWNRILRAAKKFGIEVSDENKFKE